MKRFIKKFSVAFFIFCINCDSSASDNEITWALYEKPLLIAVEVNDYNGDIIKSGKYQAEVTSVSREYGMTAEIFEIIIANRELAINECISIIRDAYSDSYESNVRTKYSHNTVGGMQNLPITIDLVKGKYIHIIPDTYYSIKRSLDFPNKTSGVFSMHKI